MRFRINNLRQNLEDHALPPEIFLSRALKVDPKALQNARIVKKSVDSRDKGDVHFVLTMEFEGKIPSLAQHCPKGSRLEEVMSKPYRPPRPQNRETPVVAGMGPAGLFAALLLAEQGLSPLVIERGAPVEERLRMVEEFWKGGSLDPDCNVQFGEGGAGAFSDGKLNSGISDPRCRFVLETLHAHGAPEEILYQARPHIGTDKLPGVVRSIRNRIQSLGGHVLFHTKLEELFIDGGTLRGIRAGGQELECGCLILAVGHSARDTFLMLDRLGIPMAPKPFSIGLRIEHKQKMIDRAQYGAFAGHQALGAAEYRLNLRTKAGRGVYTFCMCPGGDVVAAASEKGGVVTNGMSRFARDGENANSALLVGVEPSDYGMHPLSGVTFQRHWEERAYALGGGGYRAPAQLVGDLLRGVPSRGPGTVLPSYLPGVRYTDLKDCLPGFVLQALREALPLFGRKIKGFANPDALLTGVETRSSSPLRILRDAGCRSPIRGLYPCGEGAGYAGGILSAAVDGLRCAEAVMKGDAE